MADNFKFVQLQDLRLAGSGIGISDTSITLKTLQFVDETDVAMTDFGDIGFITLEPNTEREENISFTGITQNADGTATLTGVTRGLKNKSPYDQDLDLRQSHGGNSLAVVSNSAPFYNQFSAKDNDETIEGKYTFPAGGNADAPVSGTVYSAPTDDLEYVAKKYVDDIAVAGAPDATLTVKGNTEIATTAEIDSGDTVGGTGASIAVRPDQLAASIYGTQLPSSDQKDAMDGADSPDAANPFLVDSDATSTPTASKIPIADATGKIGDGWVGATTAGDVIYSDGTDLQRLGIGTANQVLQTNSGATAPEWVSNDTQGIGSTDSGVYYTYQLSLVSEAGWSSIGATFTDYPSYVHLESSDSNWYTLADLAGNGADSTAQFDDGKVYSAEFRARATNGTAADRRIGFVDTDAVGKDHLDHSGYFTGFAIDGTTLYASSLNNVDVTNTDISSGITVTNWNLYKIVFDQGTDVKLYVNGTLKATLTTTLPGGITSMRFGFGGTGGTGPDWEVSHIIITQEL
jgi:hypothetical protein